MNLRKNMTGYFNILQEGGAIKIKLIPIVILQIIIYIVTFSGILRATPKFRVDY